MRRVSQKSLACAFAVMFIFATVIGMVPRNVIAFGTAYNVSTSDTSIEVSKDQRNWQSGGGSFTEYSTVYFRVPASTDTISVKDSNDNEIAYWGVSASGQTASYGFHMPSSDVSISITFATQYRVTTNNTSIEVSNDQINWQSEGSFIASSTVYFRIPTGADSISVKDSNNNDITYSETTSTSEQSACYSFLMPSSDVNIKIRFSTEYAIVLPQIEHISFKFGICSDESGLPDFLSGMCSCDENGNPLYESGKRFAFYYSVEEGYMIRNGSGNDTLLVVFDWGDESSMYRCEPGELVAQGMPPSDVTLKIEYPEHIVCIPYTTTLYSNGGVIDDCNWEEDSDIYQTGFNIESDTIQLPIPTKENCTFAGWYTDPDFSGSPVTCIEKGTIGDVTLYAKWDTETDVGFSGHYLVLDDEICVNFRVDFPENFDPTGCYVEFLASDGEKSIVSYSAAKQVEGSASRDFSFPINALELAEDITATLYYGDGNTKVDTYSAMAYIQDAQVKYANDMRVLNLVNALHAYGYYMQQTDWKDDKPSHKAIPAPSMLLDAGDSNHCALYIDQYEVTKDFNSSGITDAKLSLTLTSKTAINVAVKLDDGVEMISSGYETIDIDGDTYYLFTLAKGIGPKGLGDDRAITITTSTGEAEITASAMAYVDLLFSSDFVTEAEEYALVAYYYYYLAALEY